MESTAHYLETLSLLVVLLPLGGTLVAGFFGQRLGKVFTHRILITLLGFSFLFSCIILAAFTIGDANPFDTLVYSWGKSGNINFQIGFLIDRLSALMMVVVTFVSWMVHIYTIGYMSDDPGYIRFFSYISLFTFGMLMLVMSNNFLQLFFGWEMVGLMSYLLIGFWFQKEASNRASLKAFLVNRVGDFGFLIGIAGVLYYFHSLDYVTVFKNVTAMDINTEMHLFGQVSVSAITVITLCLFIGAMGKSAQVPLHVWLPDSMEGPTPISALIHAATMVTAGVFMLARLSPIFEYSDTTLNVVLTIGALTALLTGFLAIVQNDIKRIIAYSTLSQLGYMMVAMGASAYAVGIFHLMTHAFFKALLFLGAGAVIIALHHEQNIWKMGNLKRYLPITYWTMLIGCLALIGFPGFSGFYSKDLIIEAVHHSSLTAKDFAYWVVLGSVFITAVYTFRLFFVVFHGKEQLSEEQKAHCHEPGYVVWLPLVLLAIPSVISGALFVGPMFQGFFGSSIAVHSDHKSFAVLADHFHGAWDMFYHGFIAIPFLLGILGIAISWLLYIRFTEMPNLIRDKCHFVYLVLIEKYGFDKFYENVIAKGVRAFSKFCWKFGDQWLIDGMGVNATAASVGRASMVSKRLQTGYLYHYAFAMISGFLLLIGWLLFF